MPRPRRAGRHSDGTATESKPDHLRALCFLHSKADRGDATLHGEGCGRPAGGGHSRISAISAETAGSRQHSTSEAIGYFPIKCGRSRSFSRQTYSTRSVSTTMFWWSLTVHGAVYALGSSTVNSISSRPKFTLLKRSVILALSVTGLPFRSSHCASLNPVVCTTSVSPSHFPVEKPV